MNNSPPSANVWIFDEGSRKSCTFLIGLRGGRQDKSPFLWAAGCGGVRNMAGYESYLVGPEQWDELAVHHTYLHSSTWRLGFEDRR